MTGNITVEREPLTYERTGQHSYWQDRALAELRGEDAPKARLERHAAEMRVEMPKLESRLRKPDGEVETRANPTRIDGQGGYFSPPLWANEFFATAPRPKRVLSGLIPSFTLEAKTSEVKLPAISVGTRAETNSDGTAVAAPDLTDAASESWVDNIAGQADVSLQALEQSPQGAHLDYVLAKDLSESYDAELEKALFIGEGKARQQLPGLFSLSGVTKVEYTGTKATEMFLSLGKVAGQLGDAREVPPEVWLMRTARWAWLGSSEDEQKRPLATPGYQPADPVDDALDDDPAAAPSILGWPTYLSDAIPANLGEAGNQDAIVLARPSDSMLFETTAKSSVNAEVLSGTLQARFSLHRYAAVLWRYPTAYAQLRGTGMKVETGF